MIKLLRLGRRFKWNASNGLKETKIFQVQKQTSAKELEWRQGCFLPQSVIVKYTKDRHTQSWGYFAEIRQSQKCLAAAPTRADESYQSENTPRMKVRLWLHKSKKVQLCSFAACFSLNHKKINDERYKHVFFFFSFLHEL